MDTATMVATAAPAPAQPGTLVVRAPLDAIPRARPAIERRPDQQPVLRASWTFG